MKQNYVLILLLNYSLSLFAQITIEYNHSPNGEQIIGNYHPFLNSEFGCVNISLDSSGDDYEKGIIKLKDSDSIRKAYIDFDSVKIKEKDNSSLFSDIKRHKIEEVEYFKLGLDSFFVINKIRTKEEDIVKPSVIKYIAAFDSITYGQYYKYNFNGTLNRKFFVKKNKNESKWERVYLKDEPIKKILFGNYNKFIDKKEFTEVEFINTIKEIQYSKNLSNVNPIYYDSSWQELKDNNGLKYKATVVDVKDSIYNLDYFNQKGNVLYKIPYSSLNPIKKTGEMRIYNNEFLESVRTYSNDSLKSVTYLYPNGKTKIENINKLKKDDFNKDVIENTFQNILDNNGVNLLENDKTALLKYNNLEVYHEIENSKVKSTYIKENSQKVYFL